MWYYWQWEVTDTYSSYDEMHMGNSFHGITGGEDGSTAASSNFVRLYIIIIIIIIDSQNEPIIGLNVCLLMATTTT